MDLTDVIIGFIDPRFKEMDEYFFHYFAAGPEDKTDDLIVIYFPHFLL